MSIRSFFSGVFTFFSEVKLEMRRVDWPTRSEVIFSTIVVFILAIVAAVFFAVIDSSAYKLVHFIIGS
jgi:preprotein translocase subunit SecE